MRFALPIPDRSSRLPAILCFVLGVALATQLLFANGTQPLPTVAAGAARLPLYAPPSIATVKAPPVIVERPIFSPRRSASQVQGGIASQAVLDGAVVGGVVTIRGRRYGVVRYPDGRIVNVGVGGRVSGWRLAALGLEGAQFVRGGERLTLPYGAAATPQSTEGADPHEESTE